MRLRLQDSLVFGIVVVLQSGLVVVLQSGLVVARNWAEEKKECIYRRSGCKSARSRGDWHVSR